MSRKAFGSAMVLALGLSGAVAAQSTPPATQEPAKPAQSMAAHTVTVEGCLVREKAVPGREPNVAERAGVMEDYILTSTKFLKGSPHTSASAATGTSGATGATGTKAGETAGTSGMADLKLEIRGIDDERLQQFVGQRVEIEGKVDPNDFAEHRREKATGEEKAGDLPELDGAVIRKASSDAPCPEK